MKITNVIIIVCVGIFSGSALTAYGEITGKVKKIRTHQYLNNQGWDGHVWFCLDNAKKVGSCSTTSACNNHTALVVSKDAAPSVMSILLAAKMAKSDITVYLDDSNKLLGSCVARLIDIL